jgi:peptidyl-prolyl cis-trans isomerase C
MNSSMFPELVVNGETVPHTLIAAETQHHEAPKGKPGIAWRKAANAVAVRTLMLQEAKRRDLRAAPAEVAPGRFETEEEALIRGLLDQVVEVAAPDTAAIQAEFDRNPDRFRSPVLWEVSHILCACDPRDKPATEKALVRATQIAKMALADPKGFASLARRESDCGSKSSGGGLGQLGPGDTVPEFEVALRPMTEGEITASPVLTRHGYHIIRLDALAEGQPLPFETVRPKISDALEKAEWAAKARAFIDQLVKSSEIRGADFKPI